MCQLYALFLRTQTYVCLIQIDIGRMNVIFCFFFRQTACLLHFSGSQLCLLQLLFTLKQSIDIIRNAYTGIPVGEVVVQWRNLDQNRTGKIVCRNQTDFRPSLGTNQLQLILFLTNLYICQLERRGMRYLLHPFGFFPMLNIDFQQFGCIGENQHTRLKTDSCCQLMAQHINLILDGSQRKLQTLKLKFVTSNIAFQSCSLTIRCPHILYQQTSL